MTKSKTKGKKKAKKGKVIGIVLVVFIIGCSILGYIGYSRFLEPNVRLERQKDQNYLFIHTGSTFEQVESLLIQENYLLNSKSFEWMALKMNYPMHIKPGKYQLKDGMSNRELISMLRSGRQTPVRVIFHNIRFKKELASYISRQIEADSISILNLLNNEITLAKYEFNPHTVMAVFIPNTYEFYWNTSAEEFLERMQKEYKRFWNITRMQKAKLEGLNQVEVSTLASVIEEETQKNDEKRTIAGVYINRLRKGMLLQADPTVRYAYGDFSIKRILNVYKEIDSKYNTYKYAGLPPGPICIPSISSLEAVLSYQKHDYLYFCAKEDFSGYHSFARTLEQHNRNAQRYQAALTRSGIMK